MFDASRQMHRAVAVECALALLVILAAFQVYSKIENGDIISFGTLLCFICCRLIVGYR